MALEPQLIEIIQTAIEGRLADVHTSLPGRVVKYNAALRTVDVKPVVKRALEKDDGTKVLESLPVIPNVPVAFPRAGGWFLQFPISVGDNVRLVFSEAATGAWRETGLDGDPGDLTRHGLSYPIAIPGDEYPLTKPLLSASNSKLTLGHDTGLRLEISGSEIELKSVLGLTDFVALAGKVLTELTAIKTAFDLHTHAGVTAGAAVSGPPVTPLPAPGSVAATKVKAE